jgi:hypothetical protein
MLKEIAPHVTRVALVANPKNTPYDYFLRSAQVAAAGLAIDLISHRVGDAPICSGSLRRSHTIRMEALSFSPMLRASRTVTSSLRSPPATAYRRSIRSASS